MGVPVINAFVLGLAYDLNVSVVQQASLLWTAQRARSLKATGPPPHRAARESALLAPRATAGGQRQTDPAPEGEVGGQKGPS